MLAFKNFNSLKDIAFFRTWATRILLNCINKFANKQKKYYKIKEEMILEDVWLDDQEIRFIELIENLNAKEKNILYLKYFLRYTDKEISRILKLPVGTVKSKHSRALKKLKKVLKRTDIMKNIEKQLDNISMNIKMKIIENVPEFDLPPLEQVKMRSKQYYKIRYSVIIAVAIAFCFLCGFSAKQIFFSDIYYFS